MVRRSAWQYLLLVAVFFSLATLVLSRPAETSVLERWLIMPGPVVQSHADVEDDCGSCHDPLSDQPQFEMCVACHTDIADDLGNKAGMHGRLSESLRFECADCHTDHEGRDTIIVDLDEAEFDHALTDFSLSGAHKTLACDSCHVAGDQYRQAASTCVGCHRDDDPHNGQLGQECDSCHVASDWSRARFDHNATVFPLSGAHESVSCTACHNSSSFADVEPTCNSCHQADDVHKGRNGSQCADCHITGDWITLTFNHLATTGFGLVGGHSGLSCQECHNSSDFRDRSGADCNACHRSDDVHETRNGSDCASCHVDSSWRTVNFDHTRDAGVALPPGHQSLECSACHKSNIHDELSQSCGGCHAGDDKHEGQLGTQCESCHVATGWTAKVWFDHDLMNFPLMGAHADVACDQCHSSAAFLDADTYCLACHASDDPHDGSFGNQCANCHNPSDWQAWQFDHDTQTDFALSGAHASVSCSSCHEASIRGSSATSSDCSSCHHREDPHAGRFGNNCGNCHDTSSFSQLEGL